MVNGTCGKAASSTCFRDLPGTFVNLGTIPAEQVAEASGGLLVGADSGENQSLALRLRSGIGLADSVWPHEVVQDSSGGNKYLFPGGLQQRRNHLNQTHWLGALLGSYNLIGTHPHSGSCP